MNKRILVTGGNGTFAKVLKQKNNSLDLVFLNKKELNILKPETIQKCILKYKPNIILHIAGLARPMKQHDQQISKSIDLNIIGTANIVKKCEKYKVKLIYFSTCYLYDGVKGNFRETDGINPINNYALSKMGGESSVRMYKNSLVLRIQMTKKPFVHKKAYSNLYSNYMFHEEMVSILPKLLNKFGIINVGGKSQSVYNFAKSHNKKIKISKINNKKIPLKQTMNLSKLKSILKNK